MISKKSFLFLALYEFIGTFLFLVGVNTAANNAAVAAIGLFIAATLTGRVSGGHFNGAITLAVYICERKWLKNLPIAIMIIIVDLLGAYCGMLVSIGLLGYNDTFSLLPPEGKRDESASSVLSVLFAEAMFTWIFVSTVLFVKYRKVAATKDGMLSNLTVALGIFFCISTSSPITGGGLNPTFGLALITSDMAV